VASAIVHVARRAASKYRAIRADEPLWIIFDGGNTDIKAMIHGRYGEEIVFPHAVRKLTAAEYETQQQAYRNRRAEFSGTAIFRAKEQAYVVGRQATQVGKGSRITGPAKYTRDHFGAMFEAAMLQLYPADHADVRVVVLHPPLLNAANSQRLVESIIGKHKLHLPDGREIAYKVTEIIPIEEPVAALQSFLLNVEGKAYSTPLLELEPGTEILTLDIGGGLTVFVPCFVNDEGGIEVNLTGAPPIDQGIQNVVDILGPELQDAFPDTLGQLKAVPLEMMHKALMTNTIIIKNDPHDCAAQVANAMQAIAFPVSQEYANRYSRGVNAAGIVIGGGGGGVSYNFMTANVLNHPYVFPAEDDLNRMRFGGIRGASKGLTVHLAQNRRN
jgi:hypothetical protein